MDHFTVTNLFDGVRRIFADEPSRLQVAALPWRRKRGSLQVMLVTSRDSGRWLLPKGWPEIGEELADAAAREAHEEAGLTGVVARAETGRYVYVKSTARDELRCQVLVYALEVTGVADKWKEKGQRKRKWVSPDDAAAMVSLPDLGRLIAAFAEADPV